MMSVRPFLLRFLAVLSTPLLAEGGASERELVRKDAQRQEVRHSMMGLRNTLVFYTYGNQQVALRLTIGNKDKSFPVTGTVFLFDPGTTEEGLAKWLNNQHSDGLYMDPAEPIETVELPEGTCAVSEPKLVGETVNEGPEGGTFADYKVKVLVKDHRVAGKFVLKGFEDQAGVFLKVIKK